MKQDKSSKEKCPMCGKRMMNVMDKKTKKLVCSDRRCGYEDTGDLYENFGKRKSRKDRGRNSHLAKKYSDNAPSGTNLGDLLKAALETKRAPVKI